MNKELINLSNLQRFLSKLNEKFALKKAMKGISEDSEGNIIIGEEGLVPTPNENSKGKFLRSDGEWALPSETAVYDSMTIEEGVAGVSKVDKVLSAKNLKQIVNSDGFLTSLDSSKLTGVINIENLPQGALERILIVSSKEERLTLLDTEVQLGDVVKESDTGLMYYVINTEKLNSEEGYTQFTAGSASSVPWSGVTDKPTIPTKTSDLTNDSDFAIDSGVVHKTGNETINGTKTFTVGPVASNSATTNGYFVKLNAVARNEVPSQLYHATFRANDKNDKILGEWCIEKSTTGCTLLNMNVRSEDANGKQLSQSLCLNMNNDGSAVRFYPSSNNKMDLGMPNNKWAKVYSDDIVHTSGDETIDGTKTFTQTVNIKNNNFDLNVTPTNNIFSTIAFRDKNNTTTAALQNSQRTYGVNDICFYVYDADSNPHGFRIRTDKKLEPIENNTYSLGSPGNIWANAYIANTYTNRVTAYSITHPSGDNNSYFYMSGGYDYDKGATLYLGGISATNFTPGRFALAARKTDGSSVELAGSPNGSLTWGGKSLAIDENLVHRSGNETIKGVKYFDNLVYLHDNMSNKNNQMDSSTTPTNTLYSHYMFVDKNNKVTAYTQYGQQNTGTDFIGLFIHDKSRALHGIQVTTNNELIPIVNNTYSLGSSGLKWANVYATTFNGNSVLCTGGSAFMSQNGSYTFLIRNDGSNTYFLMSDKDGTPGTWSTARPLTINNATGVCSINGNANTSTYATSAGSATNATYATTQATTDNSTKIATTAWVRTYVNSVVGSGSVGASISAYYSSATTLTAEGNPSTSGGSYPSDHSAYIDISPKVGTIYTGSQLFGTLNASASGSINSNTHGEGGTTLYQTTAKATATFSGAFSASAKYLCTTANAVKFRAYVSQGSSTAMGSPSVVDNSSSKSIFIRVQ